MAIKIARIPVFLVLLLFSYCLATCGSQEIDVQTYNRQYDEDDSSENCTIDDCVQFDDEIALKPSIMFAWGEVISKGIEVIGDVVGVLHKTSADHKTDEAFEKVFSSLDRNLQAITNVEETIDLMMAKSMDAIGQLEQNLNQSTAEILADVDNVGQKVDRNFGYLLEVFKIASETYTAVEKTRFEMRSEFRQVLEYAKSSRIEPTITKLNNFIVYFADEKARISQLSREDRIATLLDDNGFLLHLRESRTPSGGSLQSFMFEVIQQGYAIPQNANDSIAFAALSSLYYGVQTHISVMRYLIRMNVYLADDSYRNRDIDKYNHHMENVATDFKSFSDTLIGGRSLIDQVVGILEKAANLGFIGPNNEHSSALYLERAKNLEQEKLELKDTSLPTIQEVPGKLMAQYKFDKRSPNTPIGSWKDGAEVSYAVQYRSADNLYSKVGEWSEPFTIEDRANPRLRVPVHSTHTRLIFRRFNNKKPQFVGILEQGSQSDFWDIDRDLYNAASGSDETRAIKQASTLIASGANISARFDLDRIALHAAAMNGNTELTKTLLLNSSETLEVQDANGYTPLHVAAEGGWAEFIDLMVQHGANVNSKTRSGSTPLHLAVANGYPSAAEALMKTKNVDVNSQDNYGAGALHKAVLNGVEDVLQTLLLDKRTNINLASDGNLTSLHLSAVLKSPEITRRLIQAQSIKLNARTDGKMTALHLATISGNLPVLQLLAYSDATDINAKSDGDWTPLHYAVSLQRDSEMSELLKLNTLNVDILGARKVTPLHIAAAIGEIRAVQDLLGLGADLELQTADGLTALHLAFVNNHEDVVTLLLEKGANINSRMANGSTILHIAAAHGDLKTLQLVLSNAHGVLVDLSNNEGLTALHLAAVNNHQDIMAILLQKGANINGRTANGSAILHLLAAQGNLQTLKYTLETNVKLNMVDDNDETPLAIAQRLGHSDIAALIRSKIADTNAQLIKAAGEGQMELIRSLMDKGAELDTKDGSNETPLFKAAAHLDVVEYLVGGGASVVNKDGQGETLLHRAARQDQLELMNYLIKVGADVNAQAFNGGTPLHIAVSLGKDRIVTELLKLPNINVNLPNTDFATPLHIAAINGNAKFVSDLIARGAQVNLPIANDGQTPLHLAGANNHQDIMAILLQKGANINFRTTRGSTVLHLAATQGNVPIVNYILSIGDAKISPRNDNLETPLILAERQGHPDVANILKQKIGDISNDPLLDAATNGRLDLVKSMILRGAYPDCKNGGGWSAIQSAAENGHLDVLQYLMENGADIDSRRNEGLAPLHEASYKGYLAIVQYLVEKGADINARCNDGHTPLWYAYNQNHPDVANYLQSKGAIS